MENKPAGRQSPASHNEVPQYEHRPLLVGLGKEQLLQMARICIGGGGIIWLASLIALGAGRLTGPAFSTDFNLTGKFAMAKGKTDFFTHFSHIIASCYS
jgi:hypothetical protein